MLDSLRKCKLCPRNCGVNRLKGERGYCKAGEKIKVARVSLHFWEEPCISGNSGSGTVFFTYCNLNCVFCQNYLISQEHNGKELDIEELAKVFLYLQDRKVHNINLVSPTHYVPQIREGLLLAKEKGLSIPIVYNTNSYEKLETIQMLDGLVDIYLADLKYYTDEYACKYSKAPGYFKVATEAIDTMFKQVGQPIFSKDNILKRGVIIRHLVIPGLLEESKNVLKYIKNKFDDQVLISIMNQYTPLYHANQFPKLARKLTSKEYDEILDYAWDIGIRDAFIQEEGSASEKFVPDFLLENILVR